MNVLHRTTTYLLLHHRRCLLRIILGWVGLLSPLLGNAQEWMLVGSQGIGQSVLRDQGTSPLTYRGPEFSLSLGVARRSDCWRWYSTLMSSIGTTKSSLAGRFNYNRIGGQATLAIGGMYRCRQGWLDIWTGGGLMSMGCLHYDPNLGNTGSLLTGLSAITLSGEIAHRWTHTTRHQKTRPQELSLQMSLLPIGLYLRPGYGYNDNYTATTNLLEAILSSYQWNIKALAGIATSIRWERRLTNGNRIGLCYHWQYFSTGQTGTYRVDIANHTVALYLGFVTKDHKSSLTHTTSIAP